MPLPGLPSSPQSCRTMTPGRPSTSYAVAPAWPALAPPASPARVRPRDYLVTVQQAQVPPECSALDLPGRLLHSQAAFCRPANPCSPADPVEAVAIFLSSCLIRSRARLHA